MKKYLFGAFCTAMVTFSCSDDDSTNDIDTGIETPSSYEFIRSGASTVNFEGQTTRIQMGEEMVAAFLDNTNSLEDLTGKFAHEQDGNDFSDVSLNASSKNLRSKVAASADLFSSNTTLSNAIKGDFDGWINEQVNIVFPSWSQVATPGNAGSLQQAGGGSTRYLNAKGLELNQMFAKSLLGGLMLDQMLNNYLSTAVLDEGSNIANNNDEVLEEGANYTTMEHKWDEAYGYLYGAEADPANPVLDADQFLSEYLERVNADEDFAGIASEVFDAFALGRAAIVAGDYTLRDEQAAIIREQMSKVIAVRAVFYLQRGKEILNDADKARTFHALSEGIGFLYSLQFTRDPQTNLPYFTNTEVNDYLDTLMTANGLWDVNAETLDVISEDIAQRFNFQVSEAL